MQQWNFKMKKLCSETPKTLINELNKLGEKLLRKKIFLNILEYVWWS